MTSQFDKRKQKEVLEEITEKRNNKRDKVDLNLTAIDVVRLDNGKYDAVIIKYNKDLKIAEIVEIKAIDRSTGMLFEQKKVALKTIINVK